MGPFYKTPFTYITSEAPFLFVKTIISKIKSFNIAYKFSYFTLLGRTFKGPKEPSEISKNQENTFTISI